MEFLFIWIVLADSEGFPGSSNGKESTCNPQFNSWVGKISLESTDSSILVIPWWLRCKVSGCNVGELGSISALGRSPEEGHDNPLKYSCLENPHGQRRLAGYSPWGHKESDRTEWHSRAQDIHMFHPSWSSLPPHLTPLGCRCHKLIFWQFWVCLIFPFHFGQQNHVL